MLNLADSNLHLTIVSIDSCVVNGESYHPDLLPKA